MPWERGRVGKRGECVPDEPRVIAEAGHAGHLAVRGHATSRDASHDRVNSCVRRPSAGVSDRPGRLRAVVPHEWQ
jgi:hypothetical protein